MSKAGIITGIICISLIVIIIVVIIFVVVPQQANQAQEQELPDEEDEDSSGEFTISCDDSWDCFRPGEHTTPSWSFSIPGSDTENIDWEIDGPNLLETGNGSYASCTANESGTYTCTGTYGGKTVSSDYTLYELDVWPCAKQVQIPGFEAVILMGVIGVSSVLVIHRFHKIFKQNSIRQ